MTVRAVGMYWLGLVDKNSLPRAVIEEVTDRLVILDRAERPGASRRWDRGAFFTMWEEVPDRYGRDEVV